MDDDSGRWTINIGGRSAMTIDKAFVPRAVELARSLIDGDRALVKAVTDELLEHSDEAVRALAMLAALVVMKSADFDPFLERVKADHNPLSLAVGLLVKSILMADEGTVDEILWTIAEYPEGSILAAGTVLRLAAHDDIAGLVQVLQVVGLGFGMIPGE